MLAASTWAVASGVTELTRICQPAGGMKPPGIGAQLPRGIGLSRVVPGGGGGIFENVALTVFDAVAATVQDGALPQAVDQRANFQPAVGDAIRRTRVPRAKTPAQRPGQEMRAGRLLTRPCPAVATLRVAFFGDVPADAFAVAVTTIAAHAIPSTAAAHLSSRSHDPSRIARASHASYAAAIPDLEYPARPRLQ